MIGNRIVVRVIDQLDEPDIVFIREKKSVCDYVPSVFRIYMLNRCAGLPLCISDSSRRTSQTRAFSGAVTLSLKPAIVALNRCSMVDSRSAGDGRKWEAHYNERQRSTVVLKGRVDKSSGACVAGMVGEWLRVLRKIHRQDSVVVVKFCFFYTEQRTKKQHHLLLMLLIIWSPYSALSVILLYPHQASFLPRRSA